MAKWYVTVRLTGYIDAEVEADSYNEACDEATAIADESMAHGWDCDVLECWCEENN